MESTPTSSSTTFASSHPAHLYLDAVQEFGIELQERTRGAFRMFSLVVTLYQDRRREALRQRPKINNRLLPTRSEKFFFAHTIGPASFPLQQSSKKARENEYDLTKSSLPGHLLSYTSEVKQTVDSTFREVSFHVHDHTIGSLHRWITSQVQRHQQRRQHQQSRQEPLLQEIIFDADPHVLEDDCKDLFQGPTQISTFTPTGMMVEHARSGTLGFNAASRRHDSFSLVYVLDDSNGDWKTSHLPSMQPKRLSSVLQRTSFQASRHLSQILMAACV